MAHNQFFFAGKNFTTWQQKKEREKNIICGKEKSSKSGEKHLLGENSAHFH
jgi:hypothetical protein